ncbi:MAG: hypothetical protein WDN48_18895 [Pseudolabrys sp.]
MQEIGDNAGVDEVDLVRIADDGKLGCDVAPDAIFTLPSHCARSRACWFQTLGMSVMVAKGGISGCGAAMNALGVEAALEAAVRLHRAFVGRDRIVDEQLEDQIAAAVLLGRC